MLAFAHPLAEAFQLSNKDLGYIGCLYFWGNILFLLPAGWLLDRFGARKIVLIVMAISILLVVCSALIPNIYVFSLTRVLEGVCGGFGLTGALKLGTFYMDKKKFAAMSGVMTTVGMLGSFMIAMPLSSLIEYTTWQTGLYVVAITGVVISGLLFLATQKKPTHATEKEEPARIRTVVKVLGNSQVLLNATYVCLLNLPVYILAALWGTPMLMAILNISQAQAALITSMIFMGNMLGAPIFGFLSDYYKKRKLVMFIGLLCASLIVILMLVTGLVQIILAFILFFLLGFACSAQMVAYAVVMEQNPRNLAGSVSAVLSMVSSLGGALGQPAFGMLLSYFEAMGIAPADAYFRLSYIFLAALAFAFISVWRIKSK